MSDYVIETRQLGKRFAGRPALHEFSLNISRGGIHALIGSNGAGKSTLFRLLLGFLTPDAGESFLLGEPSLRLGPAVRGRVGYVNDEHTMPGWMRVRDLKRAQQGYYPGWREEVYRAVIANFDVRPEQRIGSLSRGERAGFNLALALAQNPELLILDEPTLGLDVVAKQGFLDALLFQTEGDLSIVYCSHQMEEVERLADELIVLEKGELRVQCAPEDFSQRVQRWIVDAAFRDLVLARVPGLLSSRVIEDQFHFHVLDPGSCFASELALLGIRGASGSPADLASAVRAYLSRNHAGVARQALPC